MDLLEIMKRRLLLPLFMLLFLQLSPLRAALVEDLYTVELEVVDQTTSVRLEAFEQAFRNVVVKVSGSIEVLNNPGLSRPLKSSSRYVHQFRYQTRKQDKTDSFTAGRLFLSVTFNQEALESLLRQNDIAVWGKERPSTLLLLSYAVDSEASIVSSDTTPELVDQLEVLAHNQGLPVLFPLLDLEDRVQFGVQDIIDNNNEKITMAAARYVPDAVLVGQITGLGEQQWQGKWQAILSGQVFNWSMGAESLDQLLGQSMAKLAQTLATEYALKSVVSVDEQILLTVHQLSALADHIKVQAYLQTLDAIESIRLVLIDQDRLTYRLKLRNTTQDLSRLISLSNVLEQMELPQVDASTEDQAIIMNYRFIQSR